MNHIEKIKQEFGHGQRCIGTAITLTNAAVSELYGQTGYDFAWIDCKHSAMSLADSRSSNQTRLGSRADGLQPRLTERTRRMRPCRWPQTGYPI